MENNEDRKWIETKRFILDLPTNWRAVIEEKMEKYPEQVKVLFDDQKGKMFHYRFRHNGFDCVLIAQEFVKNKPDYYVIAAFNNKKGLCFVRKPLEEKL